MTRETHFLFGLFVFESFVLFCFANDLVSAGDGLTKPKPKLLSGSVKRNSHSKEEEDNEHH